MKPGEFSYDEATDTFHLKLLNGNTAVCRLDPPNFLGCEFEPVMTLVAWQTEKKRKFDEQDSNYTKALKKKKGQLFSELSHALEAFFIDKLNNETLKNYARGVYAILQENHEHVAMSTVEIEENLQVRRGNNAVRRVLNQCRLVESVVVSNKSFWSLNMKAIRAAEEAWKAKLHL